MYTVIISVKSMAIASEHMQALTGMPSSFQYMHTKEIDNIKKTSTTNDIANARDMAIPAYEPLKPYAM